MLFQILIGVVMMLSTVVVHATVLGIAAHYIRKPMLSAVWKTEFSIVTVVLLGTMLCVMMAHGIEVGLWAMTFMSIDVFENTETALYFALVAYTTLGFGDIVLPEQWRLLSGFAAANGFLAFGWSTAFQVELLRELSRKMRGGEIV